jgi:hypothetical protein
MDRPARFIARHVLWVLPSLFFLLGDALDVHALVQVAFPLSATAKEWCRGNPKFFEHITVRIHPKEPSHDTTLTITQDPQNTGDLTDIQATINTQGKVPDIEAMTLTGLAFPTNNSKRTAQIILLGTLSSGHFFSIRGQANLDKVGLVTKVTGTFMFEITDTFTDKSGNPSQPVDCFGSGTLVTGKPF